MIVPRDLTPEDREELQNMLSICDIYPHRRVVFFAELLKLRAVADAMKRHPRQQHPAVQRAIEALPKYPNRIGFERLDEPDPASLEAGQSLKLI